MKLYYFCKQDKACNTLHHREFSPSLVTGTPSLHLMKKEEKIIEKKNKLNIIRVKMSSIIDDKNKTIYVIKESVGGENKVSNIIEKLILKDIKNNLRDDKEVIRYDGN